MYSVKLQITASLTNKIIVTKTLNPLNQPKNGPKSEHEGQFLTVIISFHLSVILFRFIDPCTVTLLKKHT